MDSPDDFADGAPAGRDGPAAPTVRRTSSAFGSPGTDSTVRRHDLNDVFIRHQDATFLMRAAGDDMRGAGIADGDTLLVDRALTAGHGSVIIAVIEGELRCRRLERASAERNRPLIARHVGQLEVGMKADGHRHGLGAGIRDHGLDSQLSIRESIRHLDRVGERPLLHPHRLPGELESARDPCPFVRGAHGGDLPLVGRREEAVDRNISANVPEAHIERVAPAVRIERLFVQPIRPRSHEGDAGRIRLCLEVGDRFLREPQHFVPVDAHLEGDISDRREDGYNNVGRAIGQPDDVAVTRGGVALRQDGRCERAGEHHEENEAKCVHRDQPATRRGNAVPAAKKPRNSVFSRA